MIAITLQFFSIALLGLNLFWLNSTWLGAIALVFLFFLLCRQSKNTLYTIILSLSWIVVVGTFFYYIYKLNDLTIFLTILSLLPANQIFLLPKEDKQTKNTLLLSILGLILVIAIVGLLLSKRTGEAIISPWPFTGPLFFILLFGLLCLSFIKKSSFLAAMSFTACASIALLIYKNGFGFDAFTHQAAENYIKLHGTITPKTFYYIGHYGLVVILNAVTTFPITAIDRLLVPVISVGLLAVTASRSLGKLAVLFLLLPFSFFTLTTPFSFALALFAVLLFMQFQKTPMRLELLLALSIFCVHPIVGVPALFSVLWLAIPEGKKQTTRNKILLGLIGVAALPALFLNVGKFTPHWPNITWPILFDQRYDFWIEIAHLFEILIIPTIIIGGLVATAKYYRSHLALFLIFLTSGLLTKFFISFPDIIFYEQSSFANRIIFMALLFIFIPLLFWLKEKISVMHFKSRLSKGLFFVTLSVAVIFSTYLSYPRKDVYSISKGWNVSEADFHTVEKIEAEAANNPYIVLANQATSAAALKTFGFRYLKANGDEFFFYPIPTSGKLYQYYLNIVYNHQGRKALLEAIEYAGVAQGYFAISNYWWDAEKIKNSAKLWADDWFDVDGGKITVFKIKKP